MKWYYIKNDLGWYVEIVVTGVEFDIDSEEDVITYDYKKVAYQSEATRFEMSSQACNMMYSVVKEEGFDVFLEEKK
ncbi:hypothetical protein VPH5P1C_0214 [Vibrio phage 5P1c]|nr:hypothetical protein VP495E541_P0213 [Vibrio phage 495E54-1]